MNPGRSIREDLKWTWENGVLFAGRDAGRNSMITVSSWRGQIMLEEGFLLQDRWKDNRQITGGLGSQESMLGAKLLFSHNNLWQFLFLPLSSFQDLGVQYLLLLPSPIIKIAIRERANIDDLWFGENGRQTNISFYTLSQLQSKRHCFLSKKFQKSKWGETTSLSWQKASVIERISEFQSVRWFICPTNRSSNHSAFQYLCP